MSTATIAIAGRDASRERRRALIVGKASLPPSPPQRVRGGNGVPQQVVSGVVVPAADHAQPLRNVTPAAEAPRPEPVYSARPVMGDGSARAAARARRAAQCVYGRGSTPPASATRPPRATRAIVPSDDFAVPGQSGAVVTSQRVRASVPVTGTGRGANATISGTHAIGPATESTIVSGRKVRQALTSNGMVVSGTLVRSNVHVTGDEAGEHIPITGEADGTIASDTTPARNGASSSARRFGQSCAPQAASFSTNGSRQRERRASIEMTEAGMPVTGSAVGRSLRVTGDEPGACRTVTGDQYLAPARRQAECGGTGGGTAHKPFDEAGRPDPLTGSRIMDARAAAARRVTGIDVDQHSRVTGSGVGAGLAITGTPYSAAAAAAEPERAPAPPMMRTPQRDAQLGMVRNGQPNRITGSFALGDGKVTGNLEFVFRHRTEPGAQTARRKITGEGRSEGQEITGASWHDRIAVTGTDGAFASSRNPSERAGSAKPFAGAKTFAQFASSEDPKHLVTGMFGYASDNAAKVTLSGGAQG